MYNIYVYGVFLARTYSPLLEPKEKKRFVTYANNILSVAMFSKINNRYILNISHIELISIY